MADAGGGGYPAGTAEAFVRQDDGYTLTGGRHGGPRCGRTATEHQHIGTDLARVIVRPSGRVVRQLSSVSGRADLV
jgi:hypothetical protein